jgi:hypothetical protein
VKNLLTSRYRWLLLAAVPALAIAWYLFRPELLFVNKSVNETLPAATSGAPGVAETAPQLLKTGTFESLAHQTVGTAGIYEVGSKKVLRLSGFHTSNGPDVRVYLVKGTDGKDNKTINGGGIIDLGTIKGNVGDQNYELPADFDPAVYSAVSIWCKRFAVNFGAASLK